MKAYIVCAINTTNNEIIYVIGIESDAQAAEDRAMTFDNNCHLDQRRAAVYPVIIDQSKELI